jgi:hypothetical protein
VVLREDLPPNRMHSPRIAVPSDIEEELARQFPAGDPASPDPEKQHNMINEVRALMPSTGRPLGLVVRTSTTRIYLQRLLDYSLPNIYVITEQETLQDHPQHLHAMPVPGFAAKGIQGESVAGQPGNLIDSGAQHA